MIVSPPRGTEYKGNLELLQNPLTAIFCSNRCPGNVILRTYDIARELRDAGIATIGGFQSYMEKDALWMLLRRGKQPVVICPARGIQTMRIPADWRVPLDDGRLLLLSPFASIQRRPTIKIAELRNDLVIDLATRVFILHANPGGMVEQIAHKTISAGKPLFTIDSPYNTHLIEMGATAVNVDNCATLFSPLTST